MTSINTNNTPNVYNTVGVDQGNPNGQLAMKSDGEYFYVLPGSEGQLDINRFNRDFDQYIQKRNTDSKIRIEQRLAELNKPEAMPAPYELPVGQIVINTVDTTFATMSDFAHYRSLTHLYNTIQANNRLFYIGVFFVCLAIVLYLYNFFLSDDNNNHDVTFNNNYSQPS